MKRKDILMVLAATSLIFACQNNEIQNTNQSFDLSEISDPYFRGYLEYAGLIEVNGAEFKVTPQGDTTTQLIVNLQDIASLKGIELFTELTYFGTTYYGSEEIDLSSNTKLTRLGLQLENTKLQSVDISMLSELDELFIDTNADSFSLELSSNTNITKLYLYGNTLTGVDLSELTNLQDLTMEITPEGEPTLDLSANSELKTLSVSRCDIEAVELPENSKLESFTCIDTKLTSLNLASQSNLTSLLLEYNEFSIVDLSANLNLIGVKCNHCELDELLLPENGKLDYLHCYSNNLTALDITSAPTLTELLCYDNHLTELVIPATHSNFDWLYCGAQTTPSGESQTLSLTIEVDTFLEKWASEFSECTENANVVLSK